MEEPLRGAAGWCWVILPLRYPCYALCCIFFLEIHIFCWFSMISQISMQWFVSFVLCRLMAPLCGLSVCSMGRFWPFTLVWPKVVLWFATVLAKKQPKPRAHFTCKCLKKKTVSWPRSINIMVVIVWSFPHRIRIFHILAPYQNLFPPQSKR